MSLGILTPHGVRFRGPAFTRQTRGALSAAGISTLGRRQVPDWGGQILEYMVTVDARDPEDAIARVSEVVSSHGPYAEFAADASQRALDWTH